MASLKASHYFESLLQLDVSASCECRRIVIDGHVGWHADTFNAWTLPRVPAGNRHAEVIPIAEAKIGSAQDLPGRLVSDQNRELVFLCEGSDHFGRAVCELIL